MNIIFKVRKEHTEVAYIKGASVKEEDRLAAEYFVQFYCVLSMICLLVEFTIIFFGLTLFNDKYNMIVIGCHIIGLFLTQTFLHMVSHYMYLRELFFISSVVPLTVESLSWMHS